MLSNNRGRGTVLLPRTQNMLRYPAITGLKQRARREILLASHWDMAARKSKITKTSTSLAPFYWDKNSYTKTRRPSHTFISHPITHKLESSLSYSLLPLQWRYPEPALKTINVECQLVPKFPFILSRSIFVNLGLEDSDLFISLSTESNSRRFCLMGVLKSLPSLVGEKDMGRLPWLLLWRIAKELFSDDRRKDIGRGGWNSASTGSKGRLWRRRALKRIWSADPISSSELELPRIRAS